MLLVNSPLLAFHCFHLLFPLPSYVFVGTENQSLSALRTLNHSKPGRETAWIFRKPAFWKRSTHWAKLIHSPLGRALWKLPYSPATRDNPLFHGSRWIFRSTLPYFRLQSNFCASIPLLVSAFALLAILASAFHPSETSKNLLISIGIFLLEILPGYW